MPLSGTVAKPRIVELVQAIRRLRSETGNRFEHGEQVQFALIIHELATNALKYGALSNLQGSIAIEGRIEPFNGDSRFIFRWKEHGGPPVSPPARRGFGSVILLESAREFGRVTMDYAQGGVTYELDVPIGAIAAPARSQTTSAPARASSAQAP